MEFEGMRTVENLEVGDGRSTSLPENCFNWTAETGLREAILQTLGGVSVCWTPKPAGVFQPELALELGEQLFNFITERLQEELAAFFVDEN